MPHPQAKLLLAEIATSGERAIQAARVAFLPRTVLALFGLGFGYSMFMVSYVFTYAQVMLIGAMSLAALHYLWKLKTSREAGIHRFDLALQSLSRLASFAERPGDLEVLASRSDAWSARLRVPGGGHFALDVMERSDGMRVEIMLWMPGRIDALDTVPLPDVAGVVADPRVLVLDERSSLSVVLELPLCLEERRRAAHGQPVDTDLATELAALIATLLETLFGKEGGGHKERAPLYLHRARSLPEAVPVEPFSEALTRVVPTEPPATLRRLLRRGQWIKVVVIGGLLFWTNAFLLYVSTGIGLGVTESWIYPVVATVFIVTFSFSVLPLPPRGKPLEVRWRGALALAFDGARLTLSPSDTSIDLSEPVDVTLTRSPELSEDGQAVDVAVELRQATSGGLERKQIRWKMRVVANPELITLETYSGTTDLVIPDGLLLQTVWPLLRQHTELGWDLVDEPRR